MIKTATNIVKAVFKPRKRAIHNFQRIKWVQEKILKHQDDTTIKHIRLEGLSFFYKRPYELLHSYQEIFENEIYRFQSAKSQPLIIDCGSNIGLSVLYFKKLYPNSTIIAFEPDAENFHLLQQNLEKNAIRDVQLHRAAIWIKDGSISFESNHSEASHISEKGSANTVPSLSLNNFLQKNDIVDFLKIDIEGAEWQVIKDCTQNLRKVKNLFLEYHGKVEETFKLNDLLHILQNAGFNIYIKNAADNIRHPFVDRRTNTIYDVQLNLFCYQ
jgi:FkbM family methyltransferase